ncbi:MSCRAMM family protein [Aquisphaera insulae]|uniref:MSCRAMM family protein n=1 Tax=Aquisphaera insulae TaxID=2712864 RepID=UPI0013E9EDD3|nr:carboxypeptidase regulatory-like domain-containing protein [Aquisphaera insulae]
MSILAVLLASCVSAAGETEVRGSVLGPDGRPAAGAVVQITGWTADNRELNAQGTTDPAGRFRIPVISDRFGLYDNAGPILWVHQPGSRLWVRRLPAERPFEGELPPIRLGPSARAEVVVKGPDGRPVARARVRPGNLARGIGTIPDSLAKRLDRATDDQGRASLEGVASPDLMSVEVEANGLGVQAIYAPATAGPRAITLHRTASISGRIVAPAGTTAPLRGWKVSASIWEMRGPEGNRGWNSWADVISDDQGRFRIPAIAEGMLYLNAEPPAGSAFRARHVPNRTIEPGREASAEIAIVPAVRVRGSIVEKGTGAPIVGLRIRIDPENDGTNPAVTDAQGRYSVLIVPGKVTLSIPDLPPRYHRWPAGHMPSYTVPEGPPEFDLGTLQVPPAAPPLRGVVLDDRGRPVARARVIGDWFMNENGAAISGQAADRTDAEGRFQLEGLPPRLEVKISAASPGLSTSEPVRAVAGRDSSVSIRLVAAPTLSLRGRLVGREGRPVPGALVKVQAMKTVGDSGATTDMFHFDGDEEPRTGPDGRFETPRVLPRKDDYQVTVTAEGCLSVSSGWLHARDGEDIELPDLIALKIPPSDAVVGRVLDRDGRPVEGAEVFQSGDGPQRTATRTDAAGAFRLDGFERERGFLFVRKERFRFRGLLVTPGREGLDIVVSRTTEPPEPMATRPWPVPRDAERTLAREMLTPPLDLEPAWPNSYDPMISQQAMAWGDPEGTLRKLRDRVFPQPSTMIHELARARAESSFDEAIRLVLSDRDSYARATGFLALADACDAGLLREKRAGLLGRALVETRRIEGSGPRLGLLQEIVDRHESAGDIEKARSVVRLAQPLLTQGSGFDAIPSVAQSFAPRLALVDLPAALAIVEGKTVGRPPDEPTARRLRGEIARRIAVTDPAEAERQIRLSFAGAEASRLPVDPRDFLRTCRRMAVSDLPRARRLPEILDPLQDNAFMSVPILKAMAIGEMAVGLADSRPDEARKLLAQVFDQFQGARAAPRRALEIGSARAMAALLPLVERIEPDRLAERFWQAVAARVPLSAEDRGSTLQAVAVLAAALARYDAEAARVVARPVEDAILELSGRVPDGSMVVLPNVVGPLGCVDPEAIAAIVRRIPADRETARTFFFRAPRDQVQTIRISTRSISRLALARMLGFPIDRRRRAAWDVAPWPGGIWPFVDLD